MLSKEKRHYVYSKVLLNLWNGDYLTKARKGYLSEPGSRGFFKSLLESGYILTVKDRTNKKYAKFTDDGIKYLKGFCPFVVGTQRLNIR